jgi:hypothetical protein
MRELAREGASRAKTPRPIEEWRIIVKDRYPTYVDWPTYEMIRNCFACPYPDGHDVVPDPSAAFRRKYANVRPSARVQRYMPRRANSQALDHRSSGELAHFSSPGPTRSRLFPCAFLARRFALATRSRRIRRIERTPCSVFTYV